jgi:hypothetical protein
MKRKSLHKTRPDRVFFKAYMTNDSTHDTVIHVGIVDLLYAFEDITIADIKAAILEDASFHYKNISWKDPKNEMATDSDKITLKDWLKDEFLYEDLFQNLSLFRCWKTLNTIRLDGTSFRCTERSRSLGHEIDQFNY